MTSKPTGDQPKTASVPGVVCTDLLGDDFILEQIRQKKVARLLQDPPSCKPACKSRAEARSPHPTFGKFFLGLGQSQDGVLSQSSPGSRSSIRREGRKLAIAKLWQTLLDLVLTYKCSEPKSPNESSSPTATTNAANGGHNNKESNEKKSS